MRAGALREVVELLQFNESQDEFGETDVTWTVLYKRWASVETSTASARFTGESTTAFRRYVFMLRWDPDLATINEKYRIRYRGDDYDIDSIEDIDGRRKEIRIAGELREA